MSTGSDDFVTGPNARFSTPIQTRVLPDDSVLVVDRGNFAVRRYWP